VGRDIFEIGLEIALEVCGLCAEPDVVVENLLALIFREMLDQDDDLRVV
jgi:hypothetical protein